MAPAIVRDLAMIKVAPRMDGLARAGAGGRFSGARGRCCTRIPDHRDHWGEDKIDGLLEVLRPYGVLEMVRTGLVAMRRGNTPSAALSTQESPAQAVIDDDLSQSV